MDEQSITVSEFRMKLYPKDFAAVRAFYEDTLGFTVVTDWDRGDQDKGVMFQVGPAILELLTPEEAHQPSSGVDVSWQVPDVDALWDRLKDSVSIVFKPRDNPWGDRSFCIADPEGFEVTFFSKTDTPKL